MTPYLIGVTVLVLLASIAISPRIRTIEGFYRGYSETGSAPSLWTLVLSQVTTWIFARSLMTAAILGFYYGIAGALAYAAYYFSFITGGAIINHLRFKHGYENVQGFMSAKFGATGAGMYNFVVILRLLSEVFANLIVVGEIFGLKGSFEYFTAMLAIGVITVGYSSMGGLRASLRTDVLQSVLVIVLVAILFVTMLFNSAFDMNAILNSSPDIKSPGWVLLLVAGLQVWSYPLHDPVMMDRGFLADQETTKKSFLHAAWISIACILMFALLGVFAGLNKIEAEGMIDALTRLFGAPIMGVFSVALIISALSTLDSTFSSASKLVVKDMKVLPETVMSGRIVMVAFLIVGGLFLLWDSKDLYAAVAVSGTLSMFLLPIIVFCIWGNRDVALWPVVLTFVVTVFGGITYVTESSNYTTWMFDVFGYEHKYSKLLIICIVIALVGFISFALGSKGKSDLKVSK
jgi:Na+/proline symporter